MVKAKELRIGNWFKYSQPVQIEVFTPYGVNPTYDDEGRMSEAEYTFDEIEPIPLTSEMMERLGFNVVDDNPKKKEQYEGDVLVEIAGFEFTNCMKNGFVCWEINNGNTAYKYLHELQNLYFVLTGEELEINL